MPNNNFWTFELIYKVNQEIRKQYRIVEKVRITKNKYSIIYDGAQFIKYFFLHSINQFCLKN